MGFWRNRTSLPINEVEEESRAGIDGKTLLKYIIAACILGALFYFGIFYGDPGRLRVETSTL